MEFSDKKRLFVDMDGTLARFHDQANYLERMFEKDFFRSLEPFENMVEGVRQFIHDHPDVEVFVLSARVNGEPPYCEAEKNAWLDEHLPEIDPAHRIYTEVGKSKAEYIPGGIGKNDFLLDDYNKGLNLWLYDGGSAIKCHNNINQKGLGAYGGSAGRMWVGPMVHTEDTPALIAAELSSHMGLEYDLNKVVSCCNQNLAFMQAPVVLSGKDDPQISKATARLISVPEDNTAPAHFVAVYREQNTKSFSNPLNALRWLTGSTEFSELELQCNDKSKISVSNILADALASNLYGCNIYDLLVSTRDLADVADAFQLALEEASLPIVGHVHYLGSNGKVGETAVFHDVEDMKAEIQESYDCGRPITVEWAVQPKQPQEITLYCTPDLGAPEEFKMTPDNLRMAAKICDIPLDSIDEFLCEYTWSESSLIWQEYAQYVEKAVEALELDLPRKQVEEDFYKAMSTGLYTPRSAAYFFGADLESENALHVENEPAVGFSPGTKSSLDAMISSAQGRQPGTAKDSEASSKVR